MIKDEPGSLVICRSLSLVFLSMLSSLSLAGVNSATDRWPGPEDTSAFSQDHFRYRLPTPEYGFGDAVLTQPSANRHSSAGSSVPASAPLLLAQADSGSTSRQTVGTAPEESQNDEPPVVARISDDVGGVLTRQGELVIEPSVEYSHSSRNRVALEGFTIIPAISIGQIDIREIDRDAIIPAITLRYGFVNRLEAEVKVPYVFRDDSTRTRPLGIGSVTDDVFTAEGNGIGDVEFALHYQLNRGLGGWPFFVGNVRAKAPTGKGPFDVDFDPNTGLSTELPTGSGFWALQPSLTVLYPSDPAVFFANASYLWNLSENIGGDVGEINPGDAVGFNFGMGFALNQRASFSLAYDHVILGETKQRGDNIIGSNADVGSFVVGFTHQLMGINTLNVSLNIGVTDDAPDVRMTLRLPLALRLF